MRVPLQVYMLHVLCVYYTCLWCSHCSYMVTELMQADLYTIIRTQSLSDQHVQFLVYQIVRALKVNVVCSSRLLFQVHQVGNVYLTVKCG